MAVFHFTSNPKMNTGGLKTNIFHEKTLHLPARRANLSLMMSSTTPSGNSTFTPDTISEPPCQWILYGEIGNSRVRIWDLMILVPNVLFLLFLLCRLRSTVAKLRSNTSPIFTAFYFLVFLVAVISVLRCIVSMTVNASVPAGDDADKVLWLILRFFLLATEMSVVSFGLAFGHLDSHTSIRRVLFVTFSVALVYSITQGTLEFRYPDPKFQKNSPGNGTDNFDLFAHGGMIFWLTSSLVFSIVYLCIFLLPWVNVKKYFSIPSKKSFYYYAAFLSVLNLTQAVGSGLIYFRVLKGLCVVDVTTYLYFTCFDPLVYWTFLKEVFSVSVPNIPFSYKHQVDEVAEEDTVSLPYQTPYDRDKDEHAAFSGSFDSTHFNKLSVPNSPSDSFNNGTSVNCDYYQGAS